MRLFLLCGFVLTLSQVISCATERTVFFVIDTSTKNWEIVDRFQNALKDPNVLELMSKNQYRLVLFNDKGFIHSNIRIKRN